MARFKKCTEKDISVLLETSSDSNVEDLDESYVPKENTDDDSFSFSDSEKTLDNNKRFLLRTNALQKERVSLRLKLRRSTEQSMYKIDTESEDEKYKRLTRSTKRHLKNSQDENQTPRKGARFIKLPERWSDYECRFYKSQASVLQRTQINYNEKKLLLDSLDTSNTKTQETKKYAKIKSDDDSSDCVCIDFIPKTPSTRSKSKLKQNRACSINDINVDTTPKIDKTRSKYASPANKESKKDDVDESPSNKIYFETDVSKQNFSLKDTPKRSRIEKSSKTILTMSNKCESIHKGKSKNKAVKAEVIHKVDKDISPMINQRNDDAIVSSVVCNGLHTPKVRASLKQESKLMDKSGGSIYINGVPGTGKTATVNEIVKCLKRSVEKDKLVYFDFVEINGMKLSEPRQAYVQIFKQLSGKTLTWEQAYNALEKKFNSNTKRPMTLLLVDELDLLCTKRQDVIYNLLDWPTKASARLVVVTIANTMDLPERVLMGRVTSRLGLTRVTFEPYNYKQLYEIVLTRLKNTDIFDNEIIQLIARKVSAVSGDARRALDICRRVAEITEIRNKSTVSVQDVNEALSEMIINPKVQAIKYCSKFEQIFLQAVCVEVKRIGVEEVCFINVYKQFDSLCSFDGYKTPNITQTLDICAKLGDYRLLICEYSGSDTHQKILLNISKDEMHYALQKVDSD
ncbi:origin recognition complex subunit 1 isoform X2 [Solenopsis invicta]|uniref:origin recognition complex subunit 1 isoform X2 n=1 Tax=Solenopsis invicta TaxID=13686 RepID=UPI000E33DA42|nr:origin recognition complex subunit 1 isoform X2 [Solenopsis invicta]